MRPQIWSLDFRRFASGWLPFRLGVISRWAWIISLSCWTPQARASDMLDEDLNVEPAHDNGALTTIRIAIDGGYGRWLYHPDSVSSSFKKFNEDYTAGLASSAEAAFFFWPRGGIGLQSIWFLSHASAKGVKVHDTDALSHDLRERADFFYVGPEFLARQRLSMHAVLVAGFGAGYMSFLVTELNNGVSYRIESQNYGLVASLSGDFLVLRNLGLGITGRFVFSNFRDYKVNGVSVHIRDVNNEYMWDNIPMERLELVAGLRFML